MNWKKRYSGFKKGDIVKMIKPCLSCTVYLKEACFNGAFSGELTVLKVEEDYKDGRTIKIKNNRNSFCHMNPEILELIKW